MVDYKIRDIFIFLIIFSFVFSFLWFFIDLREIESYIIGKLLNCEINKNSLICNGKTYNIVKECTGILSIAFLISIFIFDRNRINKFYIVLGIFILILWNFVRIILVIISNGNDIIHSSTWFISVILILIFIYLSYFSKSDKQ